MGLVAVHVIMMELISLSPGPSEQVAGCKHSGLQTEARSVTAWQDPPIAGEGTWTTCLLAVDLPCVVLTRSSLQWAMGLQQLARLAVDLPQTAPDVHVG